MWARSCVRSCANVSHKHCSLHVALVECVLLCIATSSRNNTDCALDLALLTSLIFGLLSRMRNMNQVSFVLFLLQMIDEVHTLIGAGAAEGAIDAANILKPALARGELQCIGATTLDEYRKHIEKDPALER